MNSAQQPVTQRCPAHQLEVVDYPLHDIPLEKALAVRAALREALAANYELVAALKRQQRQSRIVETTLASLRKLQRIGV